MPTLTASRAAGCAAPETRTNRRATWTDDEDGHENEQLSHARKTSPFARRRQGGIARHEDRESLIAFTAMPDRIRTRFLVVGSGVAGLHTAWRASEHGDVLLLTKRSLFDSATAYAQGGIAAALGAGDSPALHRQDTLAAGAALCDAAAVQVLVEEGPARVRELQTAGAALRSRSDADDSSSDARRRTRRIGSSTRTAIRPAPRSRERSSRA